jgi:predicted GNAT family N-acyltransferase
MQFRQIEPFGANHKSLRMAFTCGSAPLDRYLKEQSSQDAKKRVAIPYILMSEDNRIAGYYTLSADNLRVDDLPTELVEKLRLPRYPVVGATLLGRLARDLSFKGHGIGELLVADALKRSLRASRQVASFGVVVDAKDAHAHSFYREFGFIPFPESEGRLFLLMKTVEQMWPDP